MAIANLLVLGLGGGLVLAPIVLHLLMQPKPKPIVFPAMRFLQKSAAANRRQLRLRQWILLALRCLLILLLAAALAGPAVAASDYGNWLGTGAIGAMFLIVTVLLAASWFRANRSWLLVVAFAAAWFAIAAWLAISARSLLGSEAGPSLGRAEAPVTALILIDNSPRMSYRWENRSCLERAGELASWTVGQLPAESQIAICETRDDQPFYSVDATAAKKRISTIELCFDPLSIPEILERGLKLLEQAQYERREIYIYTDLTRASWTSQQSRTIQDQLRKLDGVSCFVIDVGTSQILNTAVSPPKIGSPVLAVNTPLKMSIDLARTGPAVERTLLMEIEKPDDTRPTIRDGKTLVPELTWQQSESVQLAENGSNVIPFEFAESLPIGVHHGRITLLGTDGLMLDNERYFTIEVRDAWKVALVHPAGVNPNDIREIIAPSSVGPTQTSTNECTVIEQDQLGQLDLSQYNAVVLLNPKPLEEATWNQLRAFVEAGGGLGISLGQNAFQSPGADSRFLSDAAVAVLGGRLTFPWQRPEGDLFIRPDTLSHAIFEQFRPIESTLNWSAFPVFTHWGIELPDQPTTPTQVLATYNNREPALIENVVGRGRVIILTTPLAEPSRPTGGRQPWNHLFVGRPFPAWLMTREIVSYLVHVEVDALNLEIGQSAVLKNDPSRQPETYTLFSPKLENSTTKVTVVNDQVRYRFTDVPGQYRLKGNLSGPVIRGFSVNLRPEDTNMSRIEPLELDNVLGPGNYQLAVDRSQIQRQQGTSRKGREFYPLLITMLTIVFGMEYLLANRFYGQAKT